MLRAVRNCVAGACFRYLLFYSCLGKAYRKAKIQKKPDKTYYDIGSNVNLTCEAEENTNLYDIRWYKLDSQGYPIELESALNGPGILILTLNSLSAKDSGIYKCVISRPEVNYHNSGFFKISVKGRTLPMTSVKSLFI